MNLLYIIIVMLLVLLVYMQVKCRMLKKDLGLKEIEQGALKRFELIQQNINVYFLLINRDFIVCETNYYALNGLSMSVKETVKRVGDLLHCRSAVEAGECGKHERCKLCCVRLSIGKAFSQKGSFKKLDASMSLLSEDAKTVIPCDVSVSGTYLNIQEEDHMLLTIYDVTELKTMQRLLDIEKENSISADKLKSAFIANMSHEIRTPLNAIVGFSGLMATATTDEEKKMYGDIITENNERLLRLVNDIFDLSQIEAQTLNFQYSEFDANDLLRELEGVFKVKLSGNPLVEVICEAHLHPIIMYSERHRIIQVLSNLLHNAMKFTEAGEIRFGCRMEGSNEVYFYVSDTGIGIPKEEQEKIFSRFIKLDREMQGTGLGLTLSQTIVKSLDGRLGVESDGRKGSTFWFALPQVAKEKI